MPLPLLPHQETGARFLAAHPRAGLFDKPGVGKTAQAIQAADLCDARRGLVICPASAREVWAQEFRKFAIRARTVVKGRDVQHLNAFLRGKIDVLILSYEMTVNWSSKLQSDLLDFVILDESHYAKSSTAQRTRAILGTHCDGANGIARWAANVWFLTGTPMSNSPEDAWPFLRFTKATPLSKKHFMDRYFTSRAGQFSTHYSLRPDMAPELRQALRAVSISRTAEQAGLTMPPIFLTTQSVEGDDREILALLRQHPGLDKAILEAVERGNLSFLDAQHIGTLRRLTGEAKAPAYGERVADMLDDGLDKIVIMGIHREALAIVRAKLAKRGFGSVLLDGQTPEAQRGDVVREFQENPKCRAFIGNMRAAGVAVTVTAAALIDLFEMSWDPATNYQALKRIHRIGQTRTCRGRFISLANSIDQHVTETVARKTADIARVEGVDLAKGAVLNI